jgi:hypothetical protein
MSMFIETSITPLTDREIVKGIEPNTSNLYQPILIVGQDKYIHTLYTTDTNPTLDFNKPEPFKLFALYSDASRLVLNVLDTNLQTQFYLIDIKSTKRKAFPKCTYSIDNVDMKVLRKPPRDLNTFNLRAYGELSYGPNMDWLFRGVHQKKLNVAESTCNTEHFTMRFATSHNNFYYNIFDITGDPQCTLKI